MWLKITEECRRFQSLIGIIGNWNAGTPLAEYKKFKFQSLIGIIGNWNARRQERRQTTDRFQSLIGIIGNWNANDPNHAIKYAVSIPHRDYW